MNSIKKVVLAGLVSAISLSAQAEKIVCTDKASGDVLSLTKVSKSTAFGMDGGYATALLKTDNGTVHFTGGWIENQTRAGVFDSYSFSNFALEGAKVKVQEKWHFPKPSWPNCEMTRAGCANKLKKINIDEIAIDSINSRAPEPLAQSTLAATLQFQDMKKSFICD